MCTRSCECVVLVSLVQGSVRLPVLPSVAPCVRALCSAVLCSLACRVSPSHVDPLMIPYPSICFTSAIVFSELLLLHRSLFVVCCSSCIADLVRV